MMMMEIFFFFFLAKASAKKEEENLQNGVKCTAEYVGGAEEGFVWEIRKEKCRKSRVCSLAYSHSSWTQHTLHDELCLRRNMLRLD